MQRVARSGQGNATHPQTTPLPTLDQSAAMGFDMVWKDAWAGHNCPGSNNAVGRKVTCR